MFSQIDPKTLENAQNFITNVGILGSLVVFMVIGAMFAMWKLGNRLIDGMLERMTRHGALMDKMNTNQDKQTELLIQHASTLTSLFDSQTKMADKLANICQYEDCAGDVWRPRHKQTAQQELHNAKAK